jgi:hypothetical protein
MNTDTWIERTHQARETSNKPDPPGYLGEVTREYQKELVAREKTYGFDQTLATPQHRAMADQELAGRLLGAGYSPQDITRTLARYSPAATDYPSEQRESYGAGVTYGLLQHEKVQAFMGAVAHHKLARGLPAEERRLDRLSLSVKNERCPAHDRSR